MIRRNVVVTVLACAAFVFACTPHPRTAAAAAPEPRNSPAGARTQPVNGLAVTLTQSTKAHAASFSLQVANPGKRTEIRFPSGKTHDFVVLDQKDREVWRWSTGRLFTQALQTRQLKTGDRVSYNATWNNARPGTYRVVAVLNSETHPDQIEQAFTVR